MFQGALSFNRDISKWQVSSVIDMRNMFRDAASFNQNLCGARWVHSDAIKTGMFADSSGSISQDECADNLFDIRVGAWTEPNTWEEHTNPKQTVVQNKNIVTC